VAAAPSPTPADARLESLWGGPKAAFAAIVAGAAALRLVGIQYGLPFGNLLNPDEQNIVPRSWAMVHGGGLDPHWYDYPTLLIYALAPTQLGQGEPSYLAARIGVVILALATVAATWWLAQRAYGSALAGGVSAAIVAVETTNVAYGHMAVTDVPLTLGVAVALALMVRGPLELAGLAVGLATGFKYPGAFLLAPLVVAGWGRWRRLAGAVALAAVAFVASSPFVAVHPGQAWTDFSHVSRLARTGWLGFEHDHWAGIAFVAQLWHGVGPVLIIAVAGLVAALVRRRQADLVLAVFVLVYFADLLTLHAHFDRYVLPLVPPLAVLAARFRALAPVTLLLLVVPLAFSVRDDSRLTRTDTRVVAERWLAEHASPSVTVAADPSTPRLPGRRVVALELPGPGRPHDPRRDVAVLRRLGVRYVLVTGVVTDRVLRAADRYPREAAFYRSLSMRARVAFEVSADGRFAGPWVRIYDLGA
jgi:4-amino-4-deoxy-L-arabinose transferase-like glycosyltransferase